MTVDMLYEVRGAQPARPMARAGARIGSVGAQAGPRGRTADRVRVGRIVGIGQAGAVRCPAGSSREGYRFGRWERLAMTIVVTAALIIAAIVIANPAARPTREVTVMPGDTMASFILREVPGMDITRAAAMIEDLNGLGDSSVRAGMRLIVPAAQ
ncbi:MAG: hypothetical protein BGO26_11005 [Actinobacteria bacterium 69-20]|jgi:hypothetical protein|nr:LysM peptidoglycan-binding domain-containing protein [Actinomycetota bacterium]OJV26306.1 MAG: hypothetical protein BGO26_11005 [Actinobacteria bacterium 69-20]